MKLDSSVIIKASAGGGGRGMRVVMDATELQKNFEMCRNEAETAFNNSEVYIERFVQNPHHVGNTNFSRSIWPRLSPRRRDCSLQRRHQKILEEALHLLPQIYGKEWAKPQ